MEKFPSLVESLTIYYRDTLSLCNWRDKVRSRIYDEISIPISEIETIIKYASSISNKKVLSVGSGWGGFSLVAEITFNAYSVGIEPDIQRARISHQRGVINTVIGIGEYLPFKNNSFFLSDCTSVIEHVKSPSMTIKEMIRVSKFIHIHAPNYLYPVEPHYKIYFIPMLPKPIARLYLCILKKNPNFISHINYITPNLIRKILHKIPNISFVSIGTAPYLNYREGSKIKRIIWNIIVKFYSLFNSEKRIELIITNNNSLYHKFKY